MADESPDLAAAERPDDWCTCEDAACDRPHLPGSDPVPAVIDGHRLGSGPYVPKVQLDKAREAIEWFQTEYSRRGAALEEIRADRDRLAVENAALRAEADRLRETLAIASDPDMAAAIREGREAVARGDVLTPAELDAVLAGAAHTATPPGSDLHTAAMRAAVRARDKWRAAEEGPMQGHPDGPECLAIAEAVLAVVADHAAGPPSVDAVERVARWLFDYAWPTVPGLPDRPYGWGDILATARAMYRARAAELIALVAAPDVAAGDAATPTTSEEPR